MRSYITSPFVWVRWVEGAGEILSPIQGKVIAFEGAGLLALLHSFSSARTLDGLDESAAKAARALIKAGVLVSATREGAPPPGLWESHDLLYHMLSRLGRGGTYRFAGKVPAEPLLKPRMKRRAIALPRPGPVVPRGFTDVLAARHSTRRYDDRPMTVRELGYLLFHAARNRRRGMSEGSETGGRPYPSGGALYPLEIYPYVPSGACAGLREGLYHYRPGDHSVERLAGGKKLNDRLARHACNAAQIQGRAWVLLQITARIARVAWKYEGIAYGLILKEVGCLYQTLYLTAEAMKLGACAVGGGPYDSLERVARVSSLDEPQVGEFFVGKPARLPRGGPTK